MSMGQIVLGIVLFAAAAAVLYAWGLQKSLDQQEDLERRLMSACGSRVVKHLKRHGAVSESEVAALIQGMTVGPFWSRRKVKVQDGGKAAGQVLAFLLDQQYIEPAGGGHYRLKK
ncbi:MAG: hypothetical protein ACI3WR_08135 [Oscillospiraceae bacterium]